VTPSAAERNSPRWRSEDKLPGWVGAICLASLAFFLRRWNLGTPHAFSFDETYYAKDAWSLLNHGYVLRYVEDADKTILNGNVTGLWLDEPSMIVHPEVGKWLIAAGIKVFGMDPTGWRMASAIRRPARDWGSALGLSNSSSRSLAGIRPPEALPHASRLSLTA